jgi:hypothetical protein
VIDLDRFRSLKLVRPTETIAVPEMKPDLFSQETPDEECVFVLRALDANEMYQIEEMLNERSEIRRLAEAAWKVDTGEMGAILRSLYDRDRTAREMVYRVELCVRGVLNGGDRPLFDYPEAVKFAKNYSLVFQRVTDALYRLRGKQSTVSD